MKFMIYIGCGVTTLGIFLATPYLRIFYDLGHYGDSVPCFQILILSLFFMTLNSPLHVGLLSSHNERIPAGHHDIPSRCEPGRRPFCSSRRSEFWARPWPQ